MSAVDQKDKRDARSAHIRDQLEKNRVKAEEKRIADLMRMRMEVARKGITAYKDGRIPDAIKEYHAYLKILEDVKNVGEHGLAPSLFDTKKDVVELLLVAGIYWDLAKVYDKLRTSSKKKEFQIFLNKFILFTKGMPFQETLAETMRKYISTSKPVHKDQFKSAYKVIGKPNCLVASGLVEEIGEGTLQTLRQYRDFYLSKHTLGRGFISFYYFIGPLLRFFIEKSPRKVRRAIAGAIIKFSGNLPKTDSEKANVL